MENQPNRKKLWKRLKENGHREGDEYVRVAEEKPKEKPKKKKVSTIIKWYIEHKISKVVNNVVIKVKSWREQNNMKSLVAKSEIGIERQLGGEKPSDRTMNIKEYARAKKIYVF